MVCIHTRIGMQTETIEIISRNPYCARCSSHRERMGGIQRELEAVDLDSMSTESDAVFSDGVAPILYHGLGIQTTAAHTKTNSSGNLGNPHMWG